jgi:hypothetical protein
MREYLVTRINPQTCLPQAEIVMFVNEEAVENFEKGADVQYVEALNFDQPISERYEEDFV